MKIETKYNIGDYVEYDRTITFGNGDTEKLKEIGIIKSVGIPSDTTIVYYLQSGYQGGISQNTITAVLGPVA